MIDGQTKLIYSQWYFALDLKIERMKSREFIEGYSKLDKTKKLLFIANQSKDPKAFVEELQSFYHKDPQLQKLFEEISENTISNFYLPFGVAPNFLIDGNFMHIPMVIEESSVVAAASKSAKFWLDKGGFHTEVISSVKVGQVHFSWQGDYNILKETFSLLKKELYKNTENITANMRERGGGITNIELIDRRKDIPYYYQLKASFETIDSMGANFINSCLEEFGTTLKTFIRTHPAFATENKEVEIIMAILSNYTPECRVKAWVETDVNNLDKIDNSLSGIEFAEKFAKAIKIAEVDVFRAVTHNKGIFNGIDSVIMATGNDFRAIEAAGHAYAARSGTYKSLSSIEIKNGRFKFMLEVPMSVGTVGGLTSLHPLAKIALRMLGKPNAKDLMKIVASAGLANHFSAVKSLVTKGIQQGHMKMHLLNILNQLNASDHEKKVAKEYFAEKKVIYQAVVDFITSIRAK
jgi:hydroxymethylglutaryl-CoA reductase